MSEYSSEGILGVSEGVVLAGVVLAGVTLTSFAST